MWRHIITVTPCHVTTCYVGWRRRTQPGSPSSPPQILYVLDQQPWVVEHGTLWAQQTSNVIVSEKWRLFHYKKASHIIFLSFFFGRSIDTALGSQWNVPNNIFWPHDLDLWPMTFTYEFDLDLSTWPPCQKSSLYVCLFGRESGNRHTHRHKHSPDGSTIQLGIPI